MAAKRLARTSGLDYAIMSGGDVAPLGGKAVTQLHELFNWAERSPRGLLLFIDEADAFLGKRGEGMSEGLRGALNALLFRTGDQSRDFAVVLATNRPGDLDAAVLDRMDEALEFPLPGERERLDILRLYLDKYIAKAGTAEGGAGAGGQTSFFARIGAMLRYGGGFGGGGGGAMHVGGTFTSKHRKNTGAGGQMQTKSRLRVWTRRCCRTLPSVPRDSVVVSLPR